MMVDEKQERLKKIKLETIYFRRVQCMKCRSNFVHEKMWYVPRWGVNEWKYDWYYCQHCFPTKEEVLAEIDSDDNPFGIYKVDPFPYNPHKTKPIPFSELPDPIGHPVLITEDNK